MPPAEKRVPHNLWWGERVPAKQGAEQQTWGTWLEEALWMSTLQELLVQAGDRNVAYWKLMRWSGKNTLSPLWCEQQAETIESLNCVPLTYLRYLNEIKPECLGTETQEPADKSLLVLPPWQPANESMNLNRLLSAFSSLLPKQSIHCRMHTLNDPVD